MEIDKKLNDLILDINDFSKKNEIIKNLDSSNSCLNEIAELGLINGKKEALYILEKILSSKIEEIKENKAIFQCVVKIILSAYIALNRTKKENETKYTEVLNNFSDIILKSRNNPPIGEALKFAFNMLTSKNSGNSYSRIFIDINTKMLKYNCNHDNNGDQLGMIKRLISFATNGCRSEIKEVFNNFISSETNSLVSENFVKNLFNIGSIVVSRGLVDQKSNQEYIYQILECLKIKPEYILPCFMECRKFIANERGILNYIKNIYKELDKLNLLDNIQNLVIQGIINEVDEENLMILYVMYHLVNENSNELENGNDIEPSVLNNSVQENIDYSINKGTNIDAYSGLSSKFTDFIRGAVIGDDNDEKYLDKINEQLINLEKLNKNNAVEILRAYAEVISCVLLLSPEAKNDITTAFEKQTTLEEKMNETFPQVGTIILNSATTNKDGKMLFREEDVSILFRMAEGIQKLEKMKDLNSHEREEVKECLNKNFLKLNFDAKKILLELVENSPDFFEKLKEKLKNRFSTNLEECNSDIDFSSEELRKSRTLCK